MKHQNHSSHNHQQHRLNPYTGLALMTVLHFLFMYGMNFLMVDAASSIFMNIKRIGILTA